MDFNQTILLDVIVQCFTHNTQVMFGSTCWLYRAAIKVHRINFATAVLDDELDFITKDHRELATFVVTHATVEIFDKLHIKLQFTEQELQKIVMRGVKHKTETAVIKRIVQLLGDETVGNNDNICAVMARNLELFKLVQHHAIKDGKSNHLLFKASDEVLDYIKPLLEAGNFRQLVCLLSSTSRYRLKLKRKMNLGVRVSIFIRSNDIRTYDYAWKHDVIKPGDTIQTQLLPARQALDWLKKHNCYAASHDLCRLFDVELTEAIVHDAYDNVTYNKYMMNLEQFAVTVPKHQLTQMLHYAFLHGNLKVILAILQQNTDAGNIINIHSYVSKYYEGMRLECLEYFESYLPEELSKSILHITPYCMDTAKWLQSKGCNWAPYVLESILVTIKTKFVDTLHKISLQDLLSGKVYAEFKKANVEFKKALHLINLDTTRSQFIKLGIQLKIKQQLRLMKLACAQ